MCVVCVCVCVLAGLDSAASFHIVQHIKTLAKDQVPGVYVMCYLLERKREKEKKQRPHACVVLSQGRTIVSTIHQVCRVLPSLLACLICVCSLLCLYAVDPY